MLHQILQWHHLLSAVDSQPWLDLRMQRVIDGLFHGLMHVVLAAGLVLLMKARHDFALSKADSYLFAGMLIGFGLWNVPDGLVFHWALQLHHIKTDATRPFVRDLVWFAVFVLLPLTIGYRLQRAAGRPGGPTSSRFKAVAASLALLVAGAGGLAGLALASGNNDDTLVVFRPGVTPAQAFNAIGRINRKVVWADSAGSVWAVKLDAPQVDAGDLNRSDALLVSQSSAFAFAFGLGCISWTKPSGASGARAAQVTTRVRTCLPSQCNCRNGFGTRQFIIVKKVINWARSHKLVVFATTRDARKGVYGK